MRIFVLLSRVPYPLDKGDKLRAFHQLSELGKRHQLILCCLSDQRVKDADLNKVSEICHELHVFHLQRWRIYLNLILSFFSRKPLQVIYFYQRPLHRKVSALIEQCNPDHIYCQLIRCAEYVKDEHNYIKTIDYQDAFSKGMDRRSERSAWPLREIFATERKRLIAYENIIFEYFEGHAIISEEDRRYIYHPERKDIAIITNGIDTDFFAPTTPRNPRYDLVFTGNMGYAPNIETAEYIVHQVLPILRKQLPEVTLLLAGANPSRKVKALEAHKGVTVSGWMDDIRDAYHNGKVFFAPMQIGTGLQNKLLEAMACALPCLTSALANKALKATDGNEILVRDSPEAYASTLVELLQDDALRASLAAKGREYVEMRFSWQASVRELESLMLAENQNAELRLKRHSASSEAI